MLYRNFEVYILTACPSYKKTSAFSAEVFCIRTLLQIFFAFPRTSLFAVEFHVLKHCIPDGGLSIALLPYGRNPKDKSHYLFENWDALLAFFKPYFFLSFIRGSLVRNPAAFKGALNASLSATQRALEMPCLKAPACPVNPPP